MLTKIQAALDFLKKTENIYLIYACESGSRAWGFASKDSDYDVRFIYGRHWKKRFSLFGYRDVIDRTKSSISETIRDLEKEELDISGWDITKTVELMVLGNAALAEWLQSPIVYAKDDIVYPWLKQASLDFFKPKASVFHYVEMASKNFKQYIYNVTGNVILKKYLYVLRPLYACAWLVLFKSPPPICFKDLYTNEEINKYIIDNTKLNIRPIVEDLIQRKQAGEELGRGEHYETLDKTIGQLLEVFQDFAKNTPVISIPDEKLRVFENQLTEKIGQMSLFL